MKKLLFLSALAAAAAAGAAPAENLLPDGGFESKAKLNVGGTASGVRAHEIYTYAPEAAHSGKLGLKLTDKWENASPYILIRVPAVKDAEGYRFRCFVKSPEGKMNCRFGMCLTGKKNGNTVNFVWINQSFPVTEEWREIVVESENKTGTETVGVMVGAAGGDKKNTGVIFADDAVLETCKIVKKNASSK